MRIPEQPFHHFADGNLFLSLRPEMADSLVCPSMLLRRVHSHNFSATTTMSFSTRRVNEWAGLVLYRTAKGYYSLLKGKNEIRLTKVLLGKKNNNCDTALEGKICHITLGSQRSYINILCRFVK